MEKTHVHPTEKTTRQRNSEDAPDQESYPDNLRGTSQPNISSSMDFIYVGKRKWSLPRVKCSQIVTFHLSAASEMNYSPLLCNCSSTKERLLWDDFLWAKGKEIKKPSSITNRKDKFCMKWRICSSSFMFPRTRSQLNIILLIIHNNVYILLRFQSFLPSSFSSPFPALNVQHNNRIQEMRTTTMLRSFFRISFPGLFLVRSVHDRVDDACNCQYFIIIVNPLIKGSRCKFSAIQRRREDPQENTHSLVVRSEQNDDDDVKYCSYGKEGKLLQGRHAFILLASQSNEGTLCLLKQVRRQMKSKLQLLTR